jgi:hypothetical protein
MNKYLSGYSYGSERPSILAAPYHNRSADRGTEKCPCCGGCASSAVVVCSTCRRDAQYSKEYAARVAKVEAKLSAAAAVS